jgi:hypothetical protein
MSSKPSQGPYSIGATAYQKTTLATYYKLPRLNLRVGALLAEESAKLELTTV